MASISRKKKASSPTLVRLEKEGVLSQGAPKFGEVGFFFREMEVIIGCKS
jgi:hypothetical protein